MVEERSHNLIVRDMFAAIQNEEPVNGFKGPSVLLQCPFYDLADSTVVDYMHSVCIGVVKSTCKIWLSKQNKKLPFYLGRKINEINDRLKKLKVPKHITRPPRNFHKCSTWKASEFRNFLLFYFRAALEKLLPEKYLSNFALLSHSIYIFLKDEISREDFQLASAKLFEFVENFEILYGIGKMNHVVHILIHIPRCVLNNGPLWCYSTFNLENKNGQITRVIKGKRNIVQESAGKFCILQANRKKTQQKDLSPSQYYPSTNFQLYESLKYAQLNGNYFCTSSFGQKKLTVDYMVEFNENLAKISKIIEKDNEMFLELNLNYCTVKIEGQINFVEIKESENIFVNCSDVRKAILVGKNSYVTIPNKFESD